MTELSTTVRSESLASVSEIDYFAWLESHIDDQATLDLAALNEHESATAYKTAKTPEITDESAHGATEYQRRTEVLQQEQKSEKWYRKIGAQFLTFGAGRGEWFIAKENDSRAKKFGKNVLRKTLDHSMVILPLASLATSIGSVAYSAIALKYGFDVPTVRQASPAWHEAIVSSPMDAHPSAPAPPAAIDIPSPAPTPPSLEAAKSIQAHYMISQPAPAPAHEMLPGPIHTTTYVPHHDAAPVPSGKEIVVLTGGATDPDAEFIKQQLIDNGTIDPNKVTIIQNHYYAEMAPFVGGHTTQESTAQGAQNLRDIIAQNPNTKITSYAFSEGNFPSDTVAADLYRQGNHDVNFVGYGSGNAASGLLNSPIAETFRPIVDGFGITRTAPAPGSTMILDGRDFYASNAGKFDIDLEAHRIVGPNEPRVMTFDVNGVHYEVVGTPVALPPGAILTSGTPAPGFGGLPELRPPDLMPNGATQLPDPNLVNIPDHVPDMNNLPPAPVEPALRSQTPSFFGEEACVAPDGSQYYTPANAPC